MVNWPILACSRSISRSRLRLGLLPNLWVERPSGVLLQLPLAGIDLVRMHLIALRQVGDSRLFPQGLPAQSSPSAPRRSSVSSSSRSSAPSITTERLQLSNLSPWSHSPGSTSVDRDRTRFEAFAGLMIEAGRRGGQGQETPAPSGDGLIESAKLLRPARWRMATRACPRRTNKSKPRASSLHPRLAGCGHLPSRQKQAVTLTEEIPF